MDTEYRSSSWYVVYASRNPTIKLSKGHFLPNHLDISIKIPTEGEE
jgi:hypothetical protein